jgi:hypothetical protein
MSTLDDEISAFNTVKDELEAKYRGEWVVFHGRSLVGAFHTFQQAANIAVKKFGRGPYLIRQVGVAPAPLPVSVMYRPPDGAI